MYLQHTSYLKSTLEKELYAWHLIIVIEWNKSCLTYSTYIESFWSTDFNVYEIIFVSEGCILIIMWKTKFLYFSSDFKTFLLWSSCSEAYYFFIFIFIFYLCLVISLFHKCICFQMHVHELHKRFVRKKTSNFLTILFVCLCMKSIYICEMQVWQYTIPPASCAIVI